MKKSKILKFGVVLWTLVMIACSLHTNVIPAVCKEQTQNVPAKKEEQTEEVQFFEGEGLPHSQWDEKIPIYSPKKKVSTKAVTTNPYSGKYGYDTLSTKEQRKAYKVLEEAADAFDNSNTDATETSSDTAGTKKYVAVAVDMQKMIVSSQIGEVVVCLIYDHPEYFWSQGYSYYIDIESSDSDALVTRVTLACHPDYADGTKRAELRETIHREIEKYMDLIVGISGDYEKELILHDAIAGKVTYAYDEKHKAQQERWAHTIEGVFSEQYYSAVCEGYAKAFQLILNAAGIENVYVVGNASGQGHAWNQVKIDGAWYNVDLTWNDTNDRKSYRYFNLPDDTFGKNHVPFSSLCEPIPKVGEWSYPVNTCTGDTYSYEKMGEAQQQPSCKVGLGRIDGAAVTILNQGVVVASGSTLTNGSAASGQEMHPDGWVAVTTGTALTLKITPDYTAGEELAIRIKLNGEEQYISGRGGQDVSCGFNPKEDTTLEVSVYVPVQSVKLNKSTSSITGYGKKETLKLVFTPKTATNPQITWVSSKPSVARVKDGVVTSVGSGRAVIYAYMEDKTVVAKCGITVKAPYIKITSPKKSVSVGKTLKLKAKLCGFNGSVRWTVSNKKIAVIGAKSGKLKGKKSGKVWVKAQIGKISARVKITVKG